MVDPSKLARNERLLVCNCQKSMTIDGAGLARSLALDAALPVYSELCRGQIKAFEAALAHGEPVHVACTQEASLFRETAAEKGFQGAELKFTNIREHSGWCEDGAATLPRTAALLAESALSPTPARVTTLHSSGVCLVYGRGQVAFDAAQQLAGRLNVTLLLSDASEVILSDVIPMPVYRGSIDGASGHLGAFEIRVNKYAPMVPSSRAEPQFVLPRDGVKTSCDLILDVSGGEPLFRKAQRRDGYFHVDPDQPAAVAQAMFEVVDLVGEFEKPIYIDYDASICAHSRSHKTGCSNCLENCPVGAISSVGDQITIDPAICQGCGSCNAVCPTGAIDYTLPQRKDLLARLSVLLKVYHSAGGRHPVLLFHDDRHGAPLISAMARFGRGLPAHVIPVNLNSVLHLGHDTLAAALAFGAEHIVLLGPPDAPEELLPLESQCAIVGTLLGGLGYETTRIHLLIERDPDGVEAKLYALPALSALPPQPFMPLRAKREVARLSFRKLKETAPAPVDIVAMPQGAPYGRIHVATDKCTLCLACVGACPANALSDSSERPQLSFNESVCVQCGLCAATCPEKAITLEPRYNFSVEAQRSIVLNQEEPFQCISCGKSFGTKSSIERVLSRLAGKHSMFQSSDQSRVIQMCDTCRIVVSMDTPNSPFKAAARPMVRTTADYLAEEETEMAALKQPDRPPH